MRLRWFLVFLIMLGLNTSICARSKNLVHSMGQTDDQTSSWKLRTDAGVPFWIAFDYVSHRVLPSPREIFVFVEPQHFTEGNLKTVFLYLSAEFPEPQYLSITARSDREKLRRLVECHRSVNSIDANDHSGQRAARVKLEEASISARSGCYRADYVRLDADERFYYYPDPDSEDGYAVVVYSSPAKFRPTGNPISDLMRATKLGLLKSVKMLIDQGTDVNVKDQYGYTPLFTATLWRQQAIAEFLLDRGARVDLKGPKGWTPLMCALSLGRLGDTDLAEELLRRGASVDARGDDGETVLTLATKKGQKSIVEELLRRHVNVNAKDASGKTALMLAEESGLEDIAKLLRRAGATK